MDQLQQIVANPLFGAVGLMVGFLSLIVGIYAFVQARKYKRLAFRMTKIDLVSNYVAKIPNAQIIYDGKPVRALSISHIIFWNEGNEIINSGDVAPADPVRIEPPEGVDILDARLSGVTNERNRIRLETTGRTIAVAFDFIEPGDGGGVEVTHSGEKILFLGYIKGAGQAKRRPWEIDDTQKVAGRMESMGSLLGDAVMVFLLIFIVAQNPANIWMALVGFLFAITIPVVWVRIAMRRSPLKRILHDMSFVI